ncbi:MAG: amidohydrolase family protein [Alphaproteobacteria bacterium]
MFDLLIRNARIADGSGGPEFAGDVAVAGGRIVAIGRLAEPAKTQIDAGGMLLMPGIVDVHTHYDAQLTWDRTASPSPSLGVTTVVTGNCGFGIAPAPPAARRTIARNLSEVEGLALAALETGIDWRFESFGEYLDLLRRKGSYPNVAVLVGHSTVRSVVMGDAASERAATDDEISRMYALVDDALNAGAIGFASSHSQNHNGFGGVPMPSRLATEREIATLAGALASRAGVFQMTAGPQTTVAFLESIAAQTGRPAIFSSVFQNDAFPERAISMLEECRAAGGRGHRVYGQTSCQPLSMDFTLANAYPLSSLEIWENLRAADPTTVAGALADPEFRDRFRAQLAAPAKGKLFYGDWRRVEFAQTMRPEHAQLDGRTVGDVAAETGTDPVDLFFDVSLAENLQTVFTAKLLNADDDKVEPLLRHDNGIISLSDAGAHLAFMCDAGFGLHLLGHWVRDRQSLTLPDAVRRLTALPAERYGIPDRGKIEIGMAADLLLLDPARVGVSAKRRVHDLPGGETRVIRDPFGVQGVWVNGILVYDGDNYVEHENAPGQILDRFLR